MMRLISREQWSWGRPLTGGGLTLLLLSCNVDEPDTGAPTSQVTESAAPTGVLPPDPGVLEPSGAFGTGNGPNPNTVIDANPMSCDGPGETSPVSQFKSCYRFVKDIALNWAQASVDCTLWSAGRGHIISVSSEDEQEYVRQLVGGTPVWLGASDAKSEGNWKWLSGEQWFYENFPAGKPDNLQKSEHCLSLTAGGAWEDLPCGQQLAYVCERPYDDKPE